MSGKRQIVILFISLLLIGGLLAAWRFAADDKTNSKNPPSTSQSSDKQATQPSESSSNNTPQPSEPSAPDNTNKTYPVKVYFSKHPASDDDPSVVFPVGRESDTLAVAKTSLTELLKGPTDEELSQGYFTTAKLRDGTSTCNGQDFSIIIENGTATLTFCKPFDHLGVVADGQAKSSIDATLKQFSSVKKVIILNSSGDCEFDLSGMNLCKQQ